MPRLPDWIIYLLALGGLLFLLTRFDERADAPEAPPGFKYSGPLLPEASALDPEILVEVGPASSGAGTAFAISREGWWLTARHVVDSCEQVGILVGGGVAAQVEVAAVADNADLALLKTERAPDPIALNLDEKAFRLGQIAFHLGFPQGAPGEAASRLIGRERLIAQGRYSLDEPILAWAEVGRTRNLTGSLSGISGGPVLNAKGEVIGVTLAESVRRGRLYTTAPSTVAALLAARNVAPQGRAPGPMTEVNYGLEHDKLRRGLSVAQVICVVQEV